MHTKTFSLPHIVSLNILMAFVLLSLPTSRHNQTVIQRPTSQSSPSSECKPLDLALLVDQSSSMSESDPDNLRFTAIQYIMQQMFYNAGLLCPTTIYNIAVIGFGDHADVLLPLSPISVPDIKGPWIETLKGYSAKVSPENLNQTDLKVAFDLAKTQLDQVTGNKADRQSAIIVVTDGMPCVSLPQSGTKYCSNSDWVSYYFNADQVSLNAHPEWSGHLSDFGFPANGLINYLNLDFPPGPNGTVIDALMFSKQPYFPAKVDPAWQQITNLHQGKYYPPSQLTDSNAIIGPLNDIINGLLQVPITKVTCNQDFYLAPYNSTTTIITSVGPAQELSNVEITDPEQDILSQGKQISGPNRIEITQYDSLPTAERYIIRNPIPGKWKITSTTTNCGDIQGIDNGYEAVTSQAAFQPLPQDTPVELDDSHFVASGSQAYASVYVTDRYTGQPVSPIPNFPIQFQTTITGPQGMQSELDSLGGLTFSPSATQPGVWQSDRPLPAPAQGSYTIQVTGSVATDNGTIQLFQVLGTYKTAPPVAVQLVPVDPLDNDVKPLNDVTSNQSSVHPFDVSVKIQTTWDKQAQPIARIFHGGNLASGAVQAELVYTDNGANQSIETITLVPNTKDPTLLSGTFRQKVDKTISDLPGQYTIKFTLTPDGKNNYNQQNYLLDASALPSVTIQRKYLTGLKLSPQSPPSNQLLNSLTAAGLPQPATISVSVQLIDQNNKPVKTSDVFKGVVNSDLNSAIYAILTGPNGTPLGTTPEKVFLAPGNQDGLFTGALRSNQTTVDAPGAYQLVFGFSDTMNFDKGDYSVVEQQTAPLSFQRTAQSAIGIRLDSPKAGDSFSLNTIGPDGKPLTSTIPVTMHLFDPAKPQGVPLAPNSRLSKDKTVQDVVSVELVDKTGAVLSTVGLSQATTNTDGTLALQLPIPQATIDKLPADAPTNPPKYTIIVIADTNAIQAAPDSLAPYALYMPSGGQPSITVSGQPQIQLSLVLEQLGGVTLDPTKPIDLVQTQLYLSWLDAFNEKINPVGLVFAVRDANNHAYDPCTLVNQSGNCDLSKAFTLAVIPPGGQGEHAVADIKIDTKTYDHPTMIVSLPSDLTQSGQYVLSYQPVVNGAFKPFVSFADSSPKTQAFNRAITGIVNNPALWRSVKLGSSIVLGLLFLVFVLNLIRINFFPRMRGTVTVTLGPEYKNPTTNRSAEIIIGGLRRPKLFRNIVRETRSVVETTTNHPRRVTVKVTPTNPFGQKVERYQATYPKPNGKPVQPRVKPNTDDTQHQIKHKS